MTISHITLRRPTAFVDLGGLLHCSAGSNPSRQSIESQHETVQLRRGIGRWSLTALVLNGVIGSSIFGLPSIAAGLIGSNSIYAYFIAALIIGLVVACFAEVASQFHSSGGPYLYTRAAFGRLAGIEVFWLTWLVRLSAAAANANLFVSYLSEFWPQAETHWYRAAIIMLMVGGLAWINYRGVSPAVLVNNTFAAFKILMFLGFIVAGLAYMQRSGVHAVAFGNRADWMDAVLILLFAFGGFEAALMPGGEVRDPRRDAPFSLFSGLVIATILYSLIQYVVLHVLPNPSASDHALSAAARHIAGPVGSLAMTSAALLCAYGYLSGQMLNVPRLTYAVAEQGDFPKFFAAVHRVYATPHVSILIYAGCVLALALAGSYKWNVTLSVASRLLTYALVCVSLPVLRRKQPNAKAFRIPAGAMFSVVSASICIALLSRMHRTEVVVLLLTISVAFVNWRFVSSSHSKPTKPLCLESQ